MLRVWRETGEGLEMELSAVHPRFFEHTDARGWGETPTRTSPRVQESLINSKEHKILNYHSWGKKKWTLPNLTVSVALSPL